MIRNCEMLSFESISGTKGQLNIIEAGQHVPFNIQRIYYITKVPPRVIRGFHSHRKLEQVLLCVNGNVSIRVKTPFEEEAVTLSDPSQGLYIGHMVWREMYDFSPGSVLLVLASEHYTEADYIRNYSQYTEEALHYFGKKEVK